MALRKLAHYAVRAKDLEASRRFYEDILQLRAGRRPAFPFPGIWLYLDDDESEFGVVHLVGEGAGASHYLGAGPATASADTGLLDHIAFLADDWPALRERCRAAGLAYVERAVPGLGLMQIFVTDPSGVTVELNFPA